MAQTISLLCLLFSLNQTEPQFELSLNLIGSSTIEVEEELGTPMRIFEIPRLNQSIWTYRRAVITFQNDIAQSISVHPTLRVSDLLVRATVGIIEPFTLRSTREDVIQAQQRGPDRRMVIRSLGKELWWYRSAVITFENGLVHGWNDVGRELNLAAPTLEIDTITISVGETVEEILARLGSPFVIKNISELNQDVWFYSDGSITFQDGIVRSWTSQRDLDRTVDDEYSGVFEVDGDPSTTAIEERIQQIDPNALHVMQGLFGVRGEANLRERLLEHLPKYQENGASIRGILQRQDILDSFREARSSHNVSDAVNN